MDKNTLDKRIEKCVNEMYRNAENIFGLDCTVDADALFEMCKNISNRTGVNVSWGIIKRCFYINRNVYDGIIRKNTSRMKRFWVIPDENSAEYTDEIRKFMDDATEMVEKINRGELEEKEFLKWRDENAKTLNLKKASHDVNYVSSNVYMLSPMTDEDGFEIMKDLWERAQRLVSDDEIENSFKNTAFDSGYLKIYKMIFDELSLISGCDTTDE